MSKIHLQNQVSRTQPSKTSQKPSQSHFGTSLGSILEGVGWLLGASWAFLGHCCGLLGALGRFLGASWAPLGRFLGALGRLWAGLGRLLGAFWLPGTPWTSIWEGLGRACEGFGEGFGRILGGFRRVWGRILNTFSNK